jgi:hypothetical protein
MRSVAVVFLCGALCVGCNRADESSASTGVQETGATTEATEPSDVGVTVAGSASLPDRPFNLLTHCGITGAMIDGMWWKAAPVLSDDIGNPPDGWGNPGQAGVLHFTDSANAIFTGKSKAGSELVANLERTESTEPLAPTCS